MRESGGWTSTVGLCATLRWCIWPHVPTASPCSPPPRAARCCCSRCAEHVELQSEWNGVLLCWSLCRQLHGQVRWKIRATSVNRETLLCPASRASLAGCFMLHCCCCCWDSALQPSTSQLLPVAAAVPAPTCRLLLHPCPAAGQWNRWATTAAALPSSLPSTSPCSSSGMQLCLAFRQRACTAMGHLLSSAAVELVLPPSLTKLPLPLPL